MVYAFTLPTTSPLAFQSFISSPTHPSLPQSASTARHALRLALKAHKRLPRGPRQDAHLSTVLSALNEYMPYLFAISSGLKSWSPQDRAENAGQEGIRSSNENPRNGGAIEITVRAEIESAWKPTLAAGNTLHLGSGAPRGGRVTRRGIDFEIAFTLTTLGYVLSRLARAGVLESVYASHTLVPEARTAAIQNASRLLLQASSVHGLLASSPAFAAATSSTVPDIDSTTQSALATLALAEATLLAVLKDDAWMVKAPEIPKVRALLFARLCVRAAEYAEQAAAGLDAVGTGASRAGRVDEDVSRYAGVLGRVARARACRLFGVDAELAGKVGEGIAWLQAARAPLGLQRAAGSSSQADDSGAQSKGGFSRLKREWAERREERKVERDAGTGRGAKGPLEPGDDAGRDEEGRVISMLETKWVKMNDTVNTQLIPPSAPLLSNLPSGRDIHSPPAPYQPPSLDESQLLRMRAPADDQFDQQYGNDPDDSEEDVSAGVGIQGPPGGVSGQKPDCFERLTKTRADWTKEFPWLLKFVNLGT
ncbi:hypothetical protein N7468_006055 [Penicillium chermesinum]|uniref:pH-response regulator protein palC n=1 Tax=Penicillium chermesinum TaxID=63820 RepID=A0A9W9P0G3_9EURO|nr:uncharacterized protein N7468_006055 [Penicillium chermesinum]KAJ5233099.1 hypothetical protein N7468_006055 [Penicillium chermesinum]